MNWTGGALNHYSGKNYRNRSQVIVQRQHFARLRKGRGEKALGSQGKPSGDRNGVLRGFVPEWERRLRRRNNGMERNEIEEYGDYNVEDGEEEKHTYSSVGPGIREDRTTGQKKTLKEFEELMRVKEQRERKREKENFRWKKRSKESSSVIRESDSEDNFHWDATSEDRDGNEKENGSQTESHNDVDYYKSEDEDFVHKMRHLLRNDDWAGLKYCRIGKDYVEWDRYLSCDSKAIDEKSTPISRSRDGKRKRQCGVENVELDRDILMSRDRSLRKRNVKLVPISNCRPSGCGNSKFRQPPPPTHRLSHRNRWHTTIGPVDSGGDISDEDISIRIGSNALRSEASSSYFRERENNGHGTEVTESDGNKAEEEDEEEKGYSDNVLIDENESTNRTDRATRNLFNNNECDFSSVSKINTMSSNSFPSAPEISHTPSECGKNLCSRDNCRISKRRKRQTERQTVEHGNRKERNCLFRYYQPYSDHLRSFTQKENSVNENEKLDKTMTAMDSCGMHQRQMSSVHQSEETPFGETDID